MENGTLAHRTEDRIDVSLIPSSAAEQLAAAACEGVLDFFQQTGVQERFEEWKRERKLRKEKIKSEKP